MTDQELYQAINNELFKTGSCKFNQWKSVTIVDGEKVALFEAILPSRGNIKIRKPIKKGSIDHDGIQIYLYDAYRFTNKKELNYIGVIEDYKPKEEVIA